MMRDGKDVAKAVTVEAGHCVEVGGERLALALLKLFDEVLGRSSRSQIPEHNPTITRQATLSMWQRSGFALPAD